MFDRIKMFLKMLICERVELSVYRQIKRICIYSEISPVLRSFFATVCAESNLVYLVGVSALNHNLLLVNR